MRTTVTLDADTESLIKAFMQQEGLSFKSAVNQAIRMGLSHPGPAFRQRCFPMGYQPQVNLDKALQIAAALDDGEILHKMTLGK